TVEADGLVDGVVSNWAACHFDPKKLRCPGGADAGDACLSDPQLAVIESLTSPIETPGGRMEPGYFLSGTETRPGAWDSYLFGAPSRYERFSGSFVRDFLAKDSTVDPFTYGLNEHPREFDAFYELQEATPHLRAFLERGKLILWTGAGDPSSPPATIVNYYNAVVDEVGGRAEADASVRFYMLGGVGHCGGGVGADRVDALLPALDAWATKNKPPKNLVATKLDPKTGDMVLSRPLCSYPDYPRYRGSGDPNEARSFTCVKSTGR
ncbi:MAG: tannase/feruloyl esterase family alpha/beta hydrolase, partial [Amphiplicatus sp.]